MSENAQLELTVLEAAVLEKLLTDEHKVLRGLRDQLSNARVKSREMSGAGFFTEFEWPGDVEPVAGASRCIRFGDVHAELEGLEHGAGFVLFVDDGVVTMLEGYSYASVWPEEETLTSLRYHPTPRDFADLDWDGSLGKLQLFQDASRRPELFVWNGAIEAGDLERWMRRASIRHAPPELVELWKQTGGGELFETESILGPRGAGPLDSSLEEANAHLRAKGLPNTHIVFHEGCCLCAFRQADGVIVELDDRFVEMGTFASFDDWYGFVRAEFAERYGLSEA